MMGAALATRRVLKPWGRRDLAPPFGGSETEPVGEIWFEPPPALDTILVKYLFTAEKLSVQVHPTDAQSPTGRGKEECWLVLAAEPGATLAVEFHAAITPDAMRAAARDGSIEQLLGWRNVRVGDLIEIPAGTVHAIGPGLTLLEVQQNTDITYRLFDYGRPRDLHLDEAIGAAVGDRHPAELRRSVNPDVEAMLLEGAHYRIAQCQGAPSDSLRARFTGPVQILPLAGSVGIGNQMIACGGSGWAERLDAVDFSDAGRCLLVAA